MQPSPLGSHPHTSRRHRYASGSHRYTSGEPSRTRLTERGHERVQVEEARPVTQLAANDAPRGERAVLERLHQHLPN